MGSGCPRCSILLEIEFSEIQNFLLSINSKVIWHWEFVTLNQALIK